MPPHRSRQITAINEIPACAELSHTQSIHALFTYPTTAHSASVCSSRKCRPPNVKRCNAAGIPPKPSSSSSFSSPLQLLLLLLLLAPYTCALRSWMASFSSLTVVDAAGPTSSDTVRDVLPLQAVAGRTTKSSMAGCCCCCCCPSCFSCCCCSCLVTLFGGEVVGWRSNGDE